MNNFYKTSYNELYHHGVKGMKWGVRRYTNPDGSLTPAGRKRQAELDAKDAWRRTTTEKGGKLVGKNKSVAVYPNTRTKLVGKNAAKRAYVETKRKSLQDSKAHNKALRDVAKNKRVLEKTAAVKRYEKKFDKAEKAQNIADKKWSEVNKQYESLGRTKIGRMINASRNKTAAAKQYSKSYDQWEKTQIFADTKWDEAKAAYVKTGRNRIERIINVSRYSG